MHVLFLSAVFTILSISIGGFKYDMQCPPNSHWKHRGNICNKTENYFCLYDANSGVYVEKCGKDGPEQQRPGYKIVIRGWLDKGECGKDRFQPFKFLTNGNSDCSLLKSRCSEEGQIAHRDGSSSSNRMCKCDYSKGYVFVASPIQRCFCDPEIEDCSCHIIQCPKGQSLYPDYRCLPTLRIENIDCLDSEERVDHPNNQSTKIILVSDEDPDAEMFTYDEETVVILEGAKGIILLTTIVFVICIILLFLGKFCYHLREAYKIVKTYDRRQSVTKVTKIYRDGQTQDEKGKKEESSNLLQHCGDKRNTENVSEEANRNLKQTFDFGNKDNAFQSINSEIQAFVDSHAFYRQQTFLKSPTTSILNILEEMKSHYQEGDDFRLCVLLLILVFENKFNTEWLDAPNDQMKNIFKQCSKENKVNINKIKETFNELDTSFVVKSADIYSIHPALYRTVAVLCCNICFKQVIEHVDSKIVAENCQFGSVCSELRNTVIVIEQKNENIYFERLLDDLKTGDGYSFFHNSNFLETHYRDKFKRFCQTRRGEISKALKLYKSKSFNKSGGCIEDVKTSDLKKTKQRNCSKLSINLPMIDCILEGYYDIFKLLVELECDVNEKDGSDRSVLYYATALSNHECVDLLLLKEANVFQVDHHNRSLLHVASTEWEQITFSLIIDACAKTELLNKPDSMGRTPLHKAVQNDQLYAAKELIEKGAEINLQDKSGKTALHIAAKGNDKQIVTYLLDKGADPSLKDKQDWTPLFRGCFKRQPDIVRVLLENNKSLINEKDRNGQTLLHIASTEGHSEIVKTLLEFDANPSITNSNGQLPLHCASEGDNYLTVGALLENNQKLVNLKDLRGLTPLHVACKRGWENIVSALLKKGADTNYQNLKKLTPLLYCMGESRSKTVRLLLKKDKSTLDICDANDTSPLNLACILGLTKIVKILLEAGANISHCNNKKNSSLHFACNRGSAEIAEMLIDKGSSVNATNNTNATPLFVACEQGHFEVVKVLLNRNADPSIPNNRNKKPKEVVKKDCNEIHKLFDRHAEKLC